MALITDVIASRRMRIAGHFLRHNNIIAHNLDYNLGNQSLALEIAEDKRILT